VLYLWGPCERELSHVRYIERELTHVEVIFWKFVCGGGDEQNGKGEEQFSL